MKQPTTTYHYNAHLGHCVQTTEGMTRIIVAYRDEGGTWYLRHDDGEHVKADLSRYGWTVDNWQPAGPVAPRGWSSIETSVGE